MVIPKQWKAFGYTFHLVTTYHDGDTEVIVYKVWRKKHQRWEYRASQREQVELEINADYPICTVSK